MKRLVIAITILLSSASAYASDITYADKVTGGIVSATEMNEIKTAVNSKADTTEALAGSCTVGPCLDGTSDGGDLIKLYGPGGFWTSLQAGNAAANRNWRLPIDAPPAAGTTRLINVDENTQMGLVDPATFLTPTGSASSLTVTATGFDGNLDTNDNTVQEIAQALDDLVVGSGTLPDGTTSGDIIQWDGDSWAVATPHAITSGTGITISSGEISVTTTTHQENFAIKTPVDADDFLLFKAQSAITVTDIHVIAQGGTSISVDVQECDSAGANCATVDAAITADTDGAQDDGAFSNGVIDAGDWVKIVLGAPSGTVNYLAGSIYYTINAD